jgi:hypothetical protein
MAGVVYEHEIHGRVREARQVVSEQLALAELTGDPALTADVSVVAIAVKHESGDVGDVLRLSQTTIEMADADPDKGNTIFGSPLAIALAARGSARFRLGRRAWRDDFDQAVAMACGSDPLSHAIVITYTYLPAIPCGALLADDRAVHDIAEALQVAEQSVNDVVLGLVRTTMGVALMHRDSLAERERGLELLGQVRDMCLQERFYQNEIRVTEMYTALERARGGDRDGAVLQLRDAIDRLFDKDQLSWSVPATAVLVETLLARGAEGDVTEAAAAIDRLAAAPADDGLVMRDIWLLRLRALVAQARGEEAAYRNMAESYRKMATDLGFEGHMAWAEAMT